MRATLFFALALVFTSPSLAETPPEQIIPAHRLTTAEFSGAQIDEIFRAWGAVQAAATAPSPLSAMHITYASDGQYTTITFSGPSREHVRDGQRYLELGSNFWMVRVRGAEAFIVQPRP